MHLIPERKYPMVSLNDKIDLNIAMVEELQNQNKNQADKPG